MTIKLNNGMLAELPVDVATPGYRSQGVSAGVIHVGVGNFHRSHQAVYFDRLFASGRDLDWGVVGAGVRPADARTRDVLSAQDWLWTVVEQSAERSTARVVGSMVDFLDPNDIGALINRMGQPDIRIVSLTVTEGGYYLEPDSGDFDADHPDIVADGRNAAQPRTVFGAIVSALSVRRATGAPAFTVMSCDNLPGNGHIARAAVVGVAALRDPGLAAWIEDNVAFPNGMVDRITPATGARERTAIVDQFGVGDAAPVFCEDFTQWVLEDSFSGGRPALDEVGVEFTSDVTPYELMKLRILNGGHAMIAYPAALLDLEFGHQAMASDVVSAFFDKVAREEVSPIVAPAPNTDNLSYLRRVQSRFANPKIEDTIARLAQDGSNRQPKFILPSVADRVSRGLDVRGLAMASAMWRRFLEGRSESGAPLPLDDPNGPRLREAALASRDQPEAFLELRDVYGQLADAPAFRAAFSAAALDIRDHGVEGALRRYLDAAG